MVKSKDDIERELAQRTGLSTDKTRELIESLADIAYREAGDGFLLRGFGEFIVVLGPETTGTNPFTGRPVVFRGPPVIQFTPDSISKERFLKRRGTPVEQPWGYDQGQPIKEVRLQPNTDDWEEATGSSSGGTSCKLGGSPNWIQADETPICCGIATQFCGQLDLSELNGPEMLYVFFCNRCYSPSSIYQCS
jgi:nucleoid DNA-binding protein